MITIRIFMNTSRGFDGMCIASSYLRLRRSRRVVARSRQNEAEVGQWRCPATSQDPSLPTTSTSTPLSPAFYEIFNTMSLLKCSRRTFGVFNFSVLGRRAASNAMASKS